MDAIQEFVPEPLRDVVRKALVHKEPNVNEALELYIRTARDLTQAETNLIDYKTNSVISSTLTPEQIYHKTQLCDMVDLAQSTHFMAYRTLLVQIYGEEVVLFHERMQRQER